MEVYKRGRRERSVRERTYKTICSLICGQRGCDEKQCFEWRHGKVERMWDEKKGVRMEGGRGKRRSEGGLA